MQAFPIVPSNPSGPPSAPGGMGQPFNQPKVNSPNNNTSNVPPTNPSSNASGGTSNQPLGPPRSGGTFSNGHPAIPGPIPVAGNNMRPNSHPFPGQNGNQYPGQWNTSCNCGNQTCGCATTGCSCATTGCNCNNSPPPPPVCNQCGCPPPNCNCPPLNPPPVCNQCGCPPPKCNCPPTNPPPTNPGGPAQGVDSSTFVGCVTFDIDLHADNQGGDGSANAVIGTAQTLWDVGATINYSFISWMEDQKDQDGNDATVIKTGTATQIAKVNATFVEWQQYANINFQLVTTPNADLRITFNPSKGNQTKGWGKKILDVTNNAWNMNLASVKDNGLNVVDVKERSNILHEFGHALGLLHEHQNPARTRGVNTITFKIDDAIEYYVDNTDETKETIQKNITNILEAKNTSAFTLVDFDSIMIYPIPGQITVEGIDINDPSELSNLDKAFITIIYPFTRQQYVTSGSVWTVEYALGILGVIEPWRTKIIQFYDAANYLQMREEFYDYLFWRANNPNPPPQQGANPGGPGMDINPGSPADDATTGSFLDIILEKMSEVFAPTTGQIFSLQFPGRFLQQEQYAWDTSAAGIYGQFVKPTVVNESEFRLVDQLYNVGTVVGAPNGINLSIVYEQCLNNLIPAFQTSALSKQQDQIRQWLLKPVPTSGWVKDLITAQQTGASASSPAPADIDPGAPITGTTPSDQPMFSVANKLDGDSVNRMELAEALMQEYLSAKQAWELERDEMIKSATPDTLNDVTRKLAHITAIREAQLASKYADAVVRGYSHTIKQYLGYMDIKSPAEFLQEAKDSLREAATSSLDASLTVYPVQMQPIDWFQGLSTSFTLEDLTSDPALIDQQIDAKSKQLDVLNSKLASLQLNPKIDTTALQAQLDAAQSRYDDAQATLSTTYSNEVISLAKSCINSAGSFLMTEFQALAKTYNVTDTSYTGIEGAMTKLSDAQQAVTQASRAYSSLLSQKALALATDTENQKTQITLDINSLTRDLDELTARRQALRPAPTTGVTPAPTTPGSINDVPILPPTNQSAGGSRWQEIIMNHTLTTQFSTESSSSTGKTSKTDIGLFLYNSHSESSSSTGQSSSNSSDFSLNVQIGFRATLVTVDRAGWFQPQFFKQSAGFYHIDETVSWSKWPAGITTLDDLKDAGPDGWDDINKYLLPAYPVGFIICKDITIKIAMSSTQMSASAANMEQTLAKSRGVLCFSTSSAETSTSSEKSYNFTSASDGIIIRIPGPQILGYYLQLTDTDNTQDMPTELPPDFLVSDAEYDSTTTTKT